VNLLRACLTACLLTLAGPIQAMDDVIDIAAARPGVFHHLEASGRSSLALAGDAVALVWEDNRSGSPGCYLALRTGPAQSFREFSFGRGECFEPAIAAYDSRRFLLIWEDAAGVNVALADANGPGPGNAACNRGRSRQSGGACRNWARLPPGVHRMGAGGESGWRR
jgi:hypothetical protein